MDYKKVAVHSGRFHADDVFAVAILKMLNPQISFIRTRNPKDLEKVDARIDVGGKYDPEKGNFDHHQKGGAGKRKNGVPYASVGLIWKHFGEELVKNEFIWNFIDEKLIQPIDLEDNGIKGYSPLKIIPYMVDDAFDALNPKWPDVSDEASYRCFEKAVNFAIEILSGEIKSASGLVEGKKILQKEISKFPNREYVVIGNYVPHKEFLINETKIKFIIFYDKVEDHWVIRAIQKNLGSFDNRKDFPKKWGGLYNEDLEKVSGVKNAKFCHKNLFIAGAYTKEAAIEMLNKTLKKDGEYGIRKD